jgi:hypothetical protein
VSQKILKLKGRNEKGKLEEENLEWHTERTNVLSISKVVLLGNASPCSRPRYWGLESSQIAMTEQMGDSAKDKQREKKEARMSADLPVFILNLDLIRSCALGYA